MKYIKTNESFKRKHGYYNNIDDVIAILNNAFIVLGIRFESYKSKGPFNENEIGDNISYPACRISLNLSKIKESILQTITETLVDNNVRHNTFPIFINSKINEHIKYGYTYAHVVLADKPATKTLTYTITAETKEEIFKNILHKLHKLYLDTTGEIIDNTMGSEVTLTKNNFITDLINNYILYVINKPMLYFTKGKFSNNDLYKMAHETIANSDKPFELYFKMKTINLKLYEHLKNFGDVEKINIGTEMGELGF